MNLYLPITYIYAREILDSRGNPTVEAEVLITGAVTGTVLHIVMPALEKQTRFIIKK